MKHDFLESMGLSKENVVSIMEESGEDIKAVLDEITTIRTRWGLYRLGKIHN